MQQDQAGLTKDVAGAFSSAAGGFDQAEGIRRFSHFGSRLVEVARITDGHHVLDVATGRGAVLFPAAARVGSTGSVVGIDLAPGMIDATAQDVAARGIKHIDLQVMDAEHLDFPPKSFDTLTSGFGVMFFPHLPLALAGFRRVLKAGGSLAVSTWGDPAPAYAFEMDLWRAYGIADRHPSGLMTNPLHTANELATVLSAAGFADVEVRPEIDELLHADAEEWWRRAFSNPISQAALQSLDNKSQQQFKSEAFARLQEARGPSGFSQQVTALFGLAHNP